MIDIGTKYKIGVRRFGLVNWIGFWTLYQKEVLRFLIVWIQTIFSPLISSLLFLLVLSLAIGTERGDIYAPLSTGEVITAITRAAVTRSIMIATVSIAVFYFIIDFEIKNYFTLIAFTFLSSFTLGALGIIAGLWAEKFDHMATITNFVIVPLSFLSGTFYTIDRLPDFLQSISKANPFFYMIDGFRYSFIETSDGSILIGLIYLFILSISIWLIAYLLYKKGYKIKS